MRAFLCFCSLLVLATVQAGEIHDACGRGDLDGVKRALQADPSAINQLDGKKLTPLMYAVRTNAAVVEFLLSKRADHKVKGFMGATALHFAATRHNVESMTALLKAGADVNARDEGNSTPAMFVANKIGPRRKEALKLLIDNKADLTVRDKEGLSIRTYSAADPELAQILKELNAKY